MANHRRLWWMLAPFALTFVNASLFHAQGQDADTTLRVTTRLVNVNVVVTNSLGNPVKDFTQDDFKLLDNGQPQKITFFSVIDNARLLLPSSTPGPPDTYTNRPADYGALPSTTILLFDTLNSHWTSQGYGLHRVRAFLRQVQPQDHLGIYVLGDDLKVVHTFTHDASDIVEAIRRYDEEHAHLSAKSTPQGDSTGDAMLDRFLSGKNNRYRFELGGGGLLSGLTPLTPAYGRDHLFASFQMTTASIEEIGRQLVSAPGRKTLIWVTDSIGTMGNFERDSMDEFLERWSGQSSVKLAKLPSWDSGLDLERMIRLMNNAGIAVYTIDARGLETVDLDFRNTTPITTIASNDQPVRDLLALTPVPDPDLLELASRTGGRAFFNRNDLETGIRRAQDDARFTYNLAYAPDHGVWKGEWRKIQVQVNRPGVTVLARGGYFAMPDPRPVPAKNLLEFFGQIAASPIESTQLPLSVHMATSRGAQNAQIEARVHLDPVPMLQRQSDGNWKGGFEVMFMQIGAKNKMLDATKKEVDAKLSAQEFEKVSKTGWDLPAQLKFMPGAKLLCVILHDKSSDAVGSVRIPLEQYSTSLSSK